MVRHLSLVMFKVKFGPCSSATNGFCGPLSLGKQLCLLGLICGIAVRAGASGATPTPAPQSPSLTPQTISFPQPAPPYAGTAVPLSATGGGSGNPVVFTVVSGPATVSGVNGSTLTYIGAGTVVVAANQAGDTNFAAAATVQDSVAVTILTQALSSPSPAISTLVTFSVAGTLGSITALTRGKANLDFNVVPGGNCAIGATYAVGQTCTVDFNFTPTHPGVRYGGIALTDAAGVPLANAYVYGEGNGPQIIWSPGTPSTVGGGLSGATGVAVNGNGDIFVSDGGNNSVKEFPAGGGAAITLGSFTEPDDVAVDGSGNVFVISNRTTLSEILAVNGAIPASPTIRTIASSFSALNGMKVDGNGNVFLASSTNDGGSSAIQELLAINGSIPATPTITTLVSGIGGPTGVAIDVNGDVYFADELGNSAHEILAVNGVIPATPTVVTLGTVFSVATNIAVDAFGNVFVTDFGDNTVKEILAVNGSIPASPTIVTLTTNANQPQGLGVDPGGNVFVAGTGMSQVLELDYADAPTLTFAATAVGSTSSDSPQTVTMTNEGNEDLIFTPPAAGSNPTISAGFTIGNGSTCPHVSSRSGALMLAAGASCTEAVNFTPVVAGPNSGKLVTTDNNLDVDLSTQTVLLNGIGLAPTTTTLTVSPDPAAYGTLVTLTASVSSSLPSTFTPTGTVTFFDNGAAIATATVTASVATLAVSNLPTGTDNLSCSYSGDSNFSSSTCNTVSERITPEASSLTIASGVNPSPALTPVTFSAHLIIGGQAAGAGNTVTFTISPTGTSVVLQFSVTTDATGTATFVPNGLYPGTYTVSAAYTATTNVQASTSNPITEMVNLNPTSTALTATPNPGYQNQPVTIVATVTALAGTAPPNGTVTLLDGTTPIAATNATLGMLGNGAFSTANFTISTLALGSHSLMAVYTPLAGNSGVNGIPFGTASGALSFLASQSQPVALPILPQDFSLSADPPSITIETQHHRTMQLTLTSIGGWTGPITLTCGSSLPPWVTCEPPVAPTVLAANATTGVNLIIDTDQLPGFLASATSRARPAAMGRLALAALLPLTLLGVARRRRYLRSLLMLALLATVMSALTACGDSRYPNHTPPGAYSIPVTASGTAVGSVVPTIHSLNITLTVTP